MKYASDCQSIEMGMVVDVDVEMEMEMELLGAKSEMDLN